MTESTLPIRDDFKQHLAKALKDYADAAANDLIEDSKRMVEKSIRMHVAQMAIHIAHEATIERNGNELLIRVKFDA